MEETPKYLKQIGKYLVSDKILKKNSSFIVLIGCLSSDIKQLVLIRKVSKNQFNESNLKELKSLCIQILAIFSTGHHPNLVKMLDLINTNDHLYIVEEYCNGGSLNEYLQKKGGNLSEKESMIIFKEILQGLEHLKKKSIIHKDINPRNILFHDNRIKISFGWSIEINQLDKNFINTFSNEIYQAPEVLKGEIHSEKSDIWSLGILLYAMLYGSLPSIEKEEIESKIKLTILITSIEIKEIKFPEKPARSSIIKKLMMNMITKKYSDRLSWQELFENELFNEKNITDISYKIEDEFLKIFLINKIYFDKNRVVYRLQELSQNNLNISISSKINENDNDLMHQERKNRKNANRMSEYLLFERNISMFYSYISTQWISINTSENFPELPVDVYYRLLFLLSKYALITMKKVLNVLVNKTKILQTEKSKNKSNIWDYFVKTGVYNSLCLLIKTDFEKIQNMTSAIEKKVKKEKDNIFKPEDQTLICKEYLELLEKNDKLENSDELMKEIKQIAFFELPLFLDNIGKKGKEVLLVIKYLIIAAQPYKIFKWNQTGYIAELDFENFYEEHENKEIELLIKEIKGILY